MQVDNDIKIADLELGEKDNRPDAPDYPVKLGLALLKDLSGVIDFSMPMSGRVDDPNFSLDGLTALAFRNVMIRVVTSPFALLAGLFQLGSGGADELQVLQFRPGWQTLESSNREALIALAALLKNNPAMRVNICGRYDPAADLPALKEAKFYQRLQRRKYAAMNRRERQSARLDELVIGRSEYARLLEEAYISAKQREMRSQDAAVKIPAVREMERYLRAATEVTEGDLQGLAMERGRRVRDFILQNNPQAIDRVSLGCSFRPDRSLKGFALNRVELEIYKK